jgi:hypothetical protein
VQGVGCRVQGVGFQVDLLILVELGGRLVQLLRVVHIPCLQRLDLWLRVEVWGLSVDGSGFRVNG